MMFRALLAAIVVGAFAIGSAAHSQNLSEGEVRKVDKEAGKVTLKHGPLENLDMPAMTMVFRVNDPAMLEKLTTGDKIRFTAGKVGGQYTVMEYEPAR